MKITSEFYETLHNPSIGSVDMYLLNKVGPETLASLGVMKGDKETVNKFVLGYNHHDELVQMLREYHKAVDMLMAALICERHKSNETFYPSKSSVWPTVEKGADLMRRLGVQL